MKLEKIRPQEVQSCVRQKRFNKAKDKNLNSSDYDLKKYSREHVRRGGHYTNPVHGYSKNAYKNPVISGYFVKEKSYKEIIISRINAGLCGILACLVMLCLASYYFVVKSEIELRKLSKETIALNFDNSDMQNKLDNLQSFSNVDMQVSKLNMLQRAKKVIELSAADLPDVHYDNFGKDATVNRYLGY